MKQGQIFKEVAKDKFDQVAAETIKSKYFPQIVGDHISTVC